MADRRQRILVVDDEPAWLDFSRKTLEEEGYFVRTASSLDEISRVLAEPKSEFNLMLVDLRYAERDGGLLGQLARSGSVEQCIVVLFPTPMTPIQMVELFKMGVVQDCVDKQYDRERLISLVRKQLQRCTTVMFRNNQFLGSQVYP